METALYIYTKQVIDDSVILVANKFKQRVIADGEDIDLDKAAELFSRSINSNEGRDGLASFFEKRKPFWDNN